MGETAVKKKLLIVVHRLSVGGVQRSLINALKFLDYDHYDVTIYVRENRAELSGQVDRRVKKVIINDDATRYYRKPRAVLLYILSRLLKAVGKDDSAVQARLKSFVIDSKMDCERKRYFSGTERFDVAVSYIQGYTAEFVARCVPADRKIVFFHGSVDENHELHQRVFTSFDRIVAVNERCRKVLEGFYPVHADKFAVVENVVDAEEIRRRSAEYSVDRRGKELVLCSCGRFSAEKGFDLAVEAAALLQKNGVDFLWYFVGDGPERQRLERMISENGLSDRIVLTGILENPYPYMAACDVYVQPSYEEAQPLAIMEAVILGRPVVSTETVGGRSILENGDKGILTLVSGAGIADGVEKLIIDENLRRSFENLYTEKDYRKSLEEYKSAWAELIGS